jgi:hypothetical protein
LTALTTNSAPQAPTTAGVAHRQRRARHGTTEDGSVGGGSDSGVVMMVRVKPVEYEEDEEW